MGKPGVVTTPGGTVDDAAGGGTDGGGTVPGTVDDSAGGNVVPITGGIVVTVHRKTYGFLTRSNRIRKATHNNSHTYSRSCGFRAHLCVITTANHLLLSTFNKNLSFRKQTVRLLHILKSGLTLKAYSADRPFGSNRERRVTFRRVITEKWMYVAQMNLDNALVLVNLCEYRRR